MAFKAPPLVSKYGPYIGIGIAMSVLMSGKLNWVFPWVFFGTLTFLGLWVARDAQLLPAGIARHLSVPGVTAKALESQETQRKVDLQELRQTFHKCRAHFRDLLQSEVSGQPEAIESILDELEDHYAKSTPVAPLAISILGRKGAGKTKLANAVERVVREVNKGATQTSRSLFGEDADFDVSSLVEIYGVAILDNASAMIAKSAGGTTAKNLKEFLSGATARKDLHLVVIFVDEIEDEDTKQVWAGEDFAEERAAAMRAVAKIRYGEAIANTMSPIVLRPFTPQMAGKALWSSFSDLVRLEYDIDVLDIDPQQNDEFLAWFKPYISRVLEGAHVDQVRREIASRFGKVLAAAQRKGVPQVIPVIHQADGELTLVSADGETLE